MTGDQEWVIIGLYRRSEFGLNGGAGVASLSLDQAIRDRAPFRPAAAPASVGFDFGEWAHSVDLFPDLGSNIASLQWWRGLATCALMCTASFYFLAPTFKPITVHSGPVAQGQSWEETRAQSIAPLAWGGDAGRRMAANDLVQPLGNAPERPTLSLTAILGQGDGFSRVLERAGASSAEARAAASLIAQETSLDQIAPGTPIELTLGRRFSRSEARPIDAIKLRARIDLSLMANRVGNRMELTRIPIAVNRTPLRIQGSVGDSLYRSARAAGVPAQALETYIRAIGSKLSFERDIDSMSRFDLIVEQARAETGEVEHGRLLYAGMTRGNRNTQLIQWTIGGRTEWFEASGIGERRGGFTSPVAGARVTSGFGRRFHPILGYARMHQGIDFGASHGTPIRAVTDGLVSIAGRNGGYGNYVRLNHNANLGSSYSHLSRISVRAGERVHQGQVIGYVGSTGLSTGPHLHFEVYRNGAAVDPRRVTFESSALLEGEQLRAFRARLASFLQIPVSGSTR